MADRWKQDVVSAGAIELNRGDTRAYPVAKSERTPIPVPAPATTRRPAPGALASRSSEPIDETPQVIDVFLTGVGLPDGNSDE